MRNHQAHLNVERLEARDLLAGLAGFTPAQIRHAYGFDQMWCDGSGETIAIVDAYDDPKILRDLERFDQLFGLPDPRSFTKVDQWGGTRFSWNDSWSDEIALDVEWAHAIAPRADILLVEANSPSQQDLDAAVAYARNQPSVVAVSMSYGWQEWNSVVAETIQDGFFTTPPGHIGGFGLPGGITFVASTGDSGAPAGYPAYSPNVLSVGGTSMFLDGAGNYFGELGWTGSGGGISTVEPEPPYQWGVQTSGARTCPDVSYNADPGTGYWVYNTETSRGWSVVGGTSAGAPQWAALIALADQARTVLTGAGSLDGVTQTLPAIYSPQMSLDFTDVTLGFNGFFAGPGYDLVTGLGTPFAPWVINDLAAWGIPTNASAGGGERASVFTSTAGIAQALAGKPIATAPDVLCTVAGCFRESLIPLAATLVAKQLPLETAVMNAPANCHADSAGRAASTPAWLACKNHPGERCVEPACPRELGKLTMTI